MKIKNQDDLIGSAMASQDNFTLVVNEGIAIALCSQLQDILLSQGHTNLKPLMIAHEQESAVKCGALSQKHYVAMAKPSSACGMFWLPFIPGYQSSI
ncbi:MAG: hypothetical protein ACJAUP_000788 [Cellvibrionaceae bacterium]